MTAEDVLRLNLAHKTAEAQLWRAAANANVATLERATLEARAAINALHAKVEALSLFAGGVLTAAGWLTGEFRTIDPDDLVSLGQTFGLIESGLSPGMYGVTPLGGRALIASKEYERSGHN